MSDWKAKRFWTEATVHATDNGFQVLLDSRSVKTPAKAPLIVPTRAMAQAIAAEWDAQVEKIDPNTMPVTRCANAAIDKVSVQHAEVADMLAAYGDSDLVCYRATDPKGLVEMQKFAWDPLITWMSEVYDVQLVAHAGVMHAPQAPEANRIMTALVHELDSFRLSAFHDLVALSGSLVIALAVMGGKLSAQEGWNASRTDEKWQQDQWGEDTEALAMAEIKRAAFLTAAEVLAQLED